MEQLLFRGMKAHRDFVFASVNRTDKKGINNGILDIYVVCGFACSIDNGGGW